MTRAVYALATALYAAARGLEWVAQQTHRAVLRSSLRRLPTARPGNRPAGPRSVP